MKFTTLLQCAYAILNIAGVHQAQLTPPKTDNILELSLAECILNITTTYFPVDSPLILQTSSSWYPAIGRFHGQITKSESYGETILRILYSSSHAPQVVFGAQKYLTQKWDMIKTIIKPGSYIIYVSGADVKAIQNLAFKMVVRIRGMLRKQNARLVIAVNNVQGNLKTRRRLATFLFEKALSRTKMENVVVLMPNLDSGLKGNIIHKPSIEVFGWMITQQKRICDGAISSTTLLDRWFINEKRFEKNNYLFPIKHITNLHGYKLQVHAYKKFNLHNSALPDGFFDWTLWTVSLHHNFKLEFISDPRIAMVRYPIPMHPTKEECVLTYPYITDVSVWYVPAGRPVPRWISLFKVFTPVLWAMVILVFVPGSMIHHILLKVEIYIVKNEMGHRLSEGMIDEFFARLAMGKVVTLRGVVTVLLFLSWQVYYLHINTAYQAALFGFLVSPGETLPIRNLEELEASGLDIMLPWTQPEIFKSFNRTAKERDAATLTNKLYGDLLIRGFYTPLGKPLLVPLEDIFEKKYYTMVINIPGCHLYNWIETLTHRIVTAGLIEHRYRQYVEYHQKLHYVNLSSNTVNAFSISSLEGPFYFMMWGLLFSSLVFLGEVMLPGCCAHFKRCCSS